MDDGRRALSHALRLLARRDSSVAGVVRKLSEKGFAESVVEETVARLQESGYLDDRRFARQWAESAIRNGRGYGLRLSLDLARRGVPAEIVTDLLSSLATEYDEIEMIDGLLKRKFAGFNSAASSDREKRRVIQYLQRRGFSTTAIFCAFRMTEDHQE
jgi:regulatory protein